MDFRLLLYRYGRKCLWYFGSRDEALHHRKGALADAVLQMRQQNHGLRSKYSTWK